MTPAGLRQPADEIAEFVRHLTDLRRRCLILRTFTRQISASDLLPHVRRSVAGVCFGDSKADSMGKATLDPDQLSEGVAPGSQPFWVADVSERALGLSTTPNEGGTVAAANVRI